MHIKKASNGRKKIVISKREWEAMGRKAGWTKKAERTIDEWLESVDFSTFEQESVPRSSEQDSQPYEVVGAWTSHDVPQEPGVVSLPRGATVRMMHVNKPTLYSDAGKYEVWINSGMESTMIRNLATMSEALSIINRLGLEIRWGRMSRLPRK